MKIIIIGAGLTGVQLAKRLIAEKNDIVLIDTNEETVRHASNRLDCMVMQANGNNLAVLEEAGIAKADALVAVTDSDELNMITCTLADTIYPHVTKIARVRNDEYYTDTHPQGIYRSGSSQRPVYGIDFMVHPDIEAAEAIVSAVEHGAVSDILAFESSNFEMMRITIEENSAFDGIAIQNIRQMVNCEALVVFVEAEGVSALPSGSTILHKENRVGILTAPQHMPLFSHLAGSKSIELKKIAIIGAGKIGTLVAEKLIKRQKSSLLKRLFHIERNNNRQVVIIDKDRNSAQIASERFPNVLVHNADVTDEGFIEEEGLTRFDLVIAVTHNHELNMVTSAYFKSLGVSKTVSVVGSAGFAAIAHKIGIDVAVSIKDVVVDSILSHLRGKSVMGVHTVAEGQFEIVELIIPESAKIIGKKVKDIALAGVFLILLIKKHDLFLIPFGDTLFEAHDKIIFIVHTNESKRIVTLFAGAGSKT